MNIENLTIGEAKDIAAMFSLAKNDQSKGNLYSKYIGKYVIVRSSNEGVNAGLVTGCDETGIELQGARRLWYHKANSGDSWYEGVSQQGLSNDSKVSMPCDKLIVEDYSITICTEKAEKSIVNHSNYKA